MSGVRDILVPYSTARLSRSFKREQFDAEVINDTKMQLPAAGTGGAMGHFVSLHCFESLEEGHR